MMTPDQEMTTSPTRIGRGWLIFFAGLLMVSFGALGYKLVDLQILRHDRLSDSARGNSTESVELAARRGEIFDIHGNKLATSMFVKTISANPTLLGRHYPEVARALSPLLGVDEADLMVRLRPTRIETKSGEIKYDPHVVLKRKVLPSVWKKIKETMANVELLNLPEKPTRKQRMFYRALRQRAIYAEAVEEQLRIYPSRQLASHVLGFVDAAHKGQEGVERVFDAQLTGAKGWRVIEHDQRGREQVDRRVQDVTPRNGLNVVLSIDSSIQNIVESELVTAMKEMKPLGITAIVVRPQTGDILAMANLPTFDPNHPGDAPAASRRNRAVTDLAEPGSTFKAVTVAAALNANKVKLHHKFQCGINGKFLYGGRILNDHHPYGILTVEKIITKSSNIGAAKIALLLGPDSFYSYIREFGFGSRTGIALPGEENGLIRSPESWTKLSITRIPMGHEVMATPLQTVMMMSAIANGGRLMKPRVIDRLEDEAGKTLVRYPPRSVRQVITSDSAREITKALRTVTVPGGTARRAELDHYTVAGKTGTAEKVIGGRYSKEKHYSSFAGFFPATAPKVCIIVAVDEPPMGRHHGGTAAAPVFKAIAERTASYLGILPDKESKKSLTATGSR